MARTDAGVTLTATPSPRHGPGVVDVSLSIDGRACAPFEVNVTPREFAFPRA